MDAYLDELTASVLKVMEKRSCNVCGAIYHDVDIETAKRMCRCKYGYGGNFKYTFLSSPHTMNETLSKWLFNTVMDWQLMYHNGLSNDCDMVTIITCLYFKFTMLGPNKYPMLKTIYDTYKSTSLDLLVFIESTLDFMCERRFGIHFNGNEAIMDNAMKLQREASKHLTYNLLKEEWEMDIPAFTSLIQWLPREMVDDTIILI